MREQEKLYNNIIKELENGTLVLPTLPEVALKVRDLVNDPDATAEKLAETIATDAALSTRLLTVANSPLYRGRVAINSVQMAVSRLGLNMVKNLVTSLVMQQIFESKSTLLNQRFKDLWQHSTEVAALCHVIAGQFPEIDTEEATLAGLIHDIGTLPILIQAEKHDSLMSDKKALDSLLHELHPRVGREILRSWDFPEELITAVAEHENMNRNSGSNGPDIADIVQVANLQSYFKTNKAMDPILRSKVLAFEKVGADMGLSVEEIDENSEEYAEALALFNMY